MIATTQAPPSPRRRFPQGIGAGAGLLAAALLTGIAGGAVWGAARPSLIINVVDGVPIVDEDASAVNAMFAGLGWFVIAATILGVVIAGIAWAQTRLGRSRGGPMYLLWVVVCALASTFAALVAGDAVSMLLHQEDPSRVAPPVTEAVVWLVAPCVAALLFWIRSVVAYATEEY